MLNPTESAYYQSLIGILRWIVELDLVDITCEVSTMASMMAIPRIGHLNQLFHIFAYLKQRHNSEMIFDPTLPETLSVNGGVLRRFWRRFFWEGS